MGCHMLGIFFKSLWGSQSRSWKEVLGPWFNRPVLFIGGRCSVRIGKRSQSWSKKPPEAPLLDLNNSNLLLGLPTCHEFDDVYCAQELGAEFGRWSAIGCADSRPSRPLALTKGLWMASERFASPCMVWPQNAPKPLLSWQHWPWKWIIALQVKFRDSRGSMLNHGVSWFTAKL